MLALSRAVADGRIHFRAGQSLDEVVAALVELPGIGPWTAHYIAMRALGHPDAFPAEDLVLQKALPNDGSRLGAKALATHAQAWQPWRGYAVIHLWRDAASLTARPASTTTTRPAARRRAATDAIA